MVFTDYPDYFADHARRPYALDSGKILDFMFARMSVDTTQISYSYTLRCYANKSLPSTKAERALCISECNEFRFATIAKCRPRAIVVLGDVSLEAFTGKTKCGEWQRKGKARAWEGVVRDFVQEVWVGYGLQYILFGSPSASVNVFRTLWKAAEDAGLKPKINPTVPLFKWPTVM